MSSNWVIQFRTESLLYTQLCQTLSAYTANVLVSVFVINCFDNFHHTWIWIHIASALIYWRHKLTIILPNFRLIKSKVKRLWSNLYFLYPTKKIEIETSTKTFFFRKSLPTFPMDCLLFSCIIPVIYLSWITRITILFPEYLYISKLQAFVSFLQTFTYSVNGFSLSNTS